ncbi:MAG: HEPN domain-containing protein [Thermoleophilia bacterium]|nr:HEPN domain-containing protein [Thermoleophilia bacterium]
MSSQADLAKQMLGLAREDLAAANALRDAEGVSASKTGFSAQQAVEKSLKAVLATQDDEFPFTHNLTLLMQLCEDVGHPVPPDLAEADRLTPYAVAIRYGLANPESVAPDEAVRWAARAVDWAAAKVG